MSNRRSYSASQYSGGSKKSKSKSKSYSPPRGGGADMGTVSTPTRKANPTLALNSLIEQRKTDQVNRRIAANKEARAMALTPPKRNLRQKIGGGINRVLNNPFVRTYAAWGTGGLSEKMRQAMGIKSLYDNRNILDDEAIEEEVRNIPVTGGITVSPISFNQTPPNQSNIAYDERLGYVDLNTGQPINMAMPGATQAGVADAQKTIIGGQMGGLKEGLFPVQNVYDKAKKFDDTGIFGIGSDEMTKQEFNEYIKSQGYTGPGLELANGGVVNLFKYGGFLG